VLEIERGLLELVIDFVHGFESVVLENFLANLVPEIFLRVELRRVGWQKGQLDVSGDYQIAAAVIACTIDETTGRSDPPSFPDSIRKTLFLKAFCASTS
jgi:hypothetical protein